MARRNNPLVTRRVARWTSSPTARDCEWLTLPDGDVFVERQREVIRFGLVSKSSSFVSLCETR